MALRRFAQIGFAALMAFGLLGFGFAVQAADVTFTGSTTVLPIAQAVAEALADQFDIEVAGGGSSVGVAALLDGTTDIGDHSRSIKSSEYEKAVQAGVFPFTFHVANDAIAVVVHPSNGIANLTIEQLRAIYTGEITNWSQVGGNSGEIVVVGRDSASGTFETWELLVMDKEDPASSVLALSSNADVASEVANNANAIGYAGIAYINPQLKAITIDGKVASLETAINYSYPIARPLFMSTNGFPAPGPVLDIILFVLSDAGQRLVEEVGYAPIRVLP
ncbi:phosphate ABC transporter substrate-binding protein [Candidatus Bipolaricaulota bacterium]|nr:phosphate ABC transporter substrate-binding protein [Candidatus Bipolaricaulota bacterium]